MFTAYIILCILGIIYIIVASFALIFSAINNSASSQVKNSTKKRFSQNHYANDDDFFDTDSHHDSGGFFDSGSSYDSGSSFGGSSYDSSSSSSSDSSYDNNSSSF